MRGTTPDGGEVQLRVREARKGLALQNPPPRPSEPTPSPELGDAWAGHAVPRLPAAARGRCPLPCQHPVTDPKRRPCQTPLSHGGLRCWLCLWRDVGLGCGWNGASPAGLGGCASALRHHGGKGGWVWGVALICCCSSPFNAKILLQMPRKSTDSCPALPQGLVDPTPRRATTRPGSVHTRELRYCCRDRGQR